MTDPDTYLANFQRRVIEDAINEATATYWHRRAATYEWARERPGDYLGRSTPEQRAARDADLVAHIERCHYLAGLALIGDWEMAA